MASQRLLQREKYIKVSGLFLMVSPFFNFFVSVFAALGPNRKLTQPIFIEIVKQIPLLVWALWIPVLITGFMMFRGRRTSWVSVLGLLGVFIICNIINFKHDMKYGVWQPTIYLLTNVSLFILVYSQEFHQKAQQKGLALISKMREVKANGATVSFDGFGPWAKIIAVTTTHISMRAFASAPTDIQTRILEIVLSKTLVIRARYSKHTSTFSGQEDYFFELIEMDSKTRYALEDWLVMKNYAKFKSAASADAKQAAFTSPSNTPEPIIEPNKKVS